MKIAFIGRNRPNITAHLETLTKAYGNASVEEADVIVALGGDGLMLQILHQYIRLQVPVYGMNCGTVGFLMNTLSLDNLLERLENAESAVLYPLVMEATLMDGRLNKALAINEVSLLRQQHHAAKIQITIDKVVRMENLTCDGILVASPAGSTAYNFSASGPILPLSSNLLALTPISPFRPRGWRGALLPAESVIEFTPLDPESRPVSATADFTEARNVRHVKIYADRSQFARLMFDKGHHLEERILSEQFFNT